VRGVIIALGLGLVRDVIIALGLGSGYLVYGLGKVCRWEMYIYVLIN
jgi:hypothetical protein